MISCGRVGVLCSKFWPVIKTPWWVPEEEGLLWGLRVGGAIVALASYLCCQGGKKI